MLYILVSNKDIIVQSRKQSKIHSKPKPYINTKFIACHGFSLILGDFYSKKFIATFCKNKKTHDRKDLQSTTIAKIDFYLT